MTVSERTKLRADLMTLLLREAGTCCPECFEDLEPDDGLIFALVNFIEDREVGR